MYKLFVILMVSLSAIYTGTLFIFNIKDHFTHWIGIYKIRYVLDKMPDGLSHFFYRNTIQGLINKESSKIIDHHIYTAFIYDVNSLIILKSNNRCNVNE